MNRQMFPADGISYKITNDYVLQGLCKTESSEASCRLNFLSDIQEICIKYIMLMNRLTLPAD